MVTSEIQPKQTIMWAKFSVSLLGPTLRNSGQHLRLAHSSANEPAGSLLNRIVTFEKFGGLKLSWLTAGRTELAGENADTNNTSFPPLKPTEAAEGGGGRSLPRSRSLEGGTPS